MEGMQHDTRAAGDGVVDQEIRLLARVDEAWCLRVDLYGARRRR